MNTYKLHPLGTLKSGADVSVLQLNDEYKKALTLAEQFSHVILFYIGTSMSGIGPLDELIEGLSVSDIRFTLAGLVSADHKTGVLTLDPVLPEGTLIVDIKPYFPVEDRVKAPLTPAAFRKLPAFYSGPESVPGNSAKQPSDNSVTQIGEITRSGSRYFISLQNDARKIITRYQNFSHIQIIWWFSRFEKDV